MAKSKAKSQRRVRVRRVVRVVGVKRRNRQRRGGMGMSMGEGARAYSRLILDPCMAPLIQSPYGGSDASVVARKVGVRANVDVNQLVFYHPVYGYWAASSATLTGALTLTNDLAVDDRIVGGRAIAGCLSVAYFGKETDRAGLVYCGVVPGNLVWNFAASASGGNGVALTLLEVQAKLAKVQRMPVDRCEVNWFPSEGDADNTIPYYPNAGQTSALEVAFSKVHFCAVLVTGMAATSVIFKTTGVGEQQSFVSGAAQTWAVPSSIAPKFDWRQVLSVLGEKDSTWYLDTFSKLGELASGTGMAYASMGLPGALAYITAGVAGMAVRSRQSVKS